MARDERIDLCIIGAGPAGIAAAEQAAAREARVVLVEGGELGGVSHNWGSLPAQALAAAAERAHAIRTARDLGVGADEPRINFARVNTRIRAAIDEANPNVSAEHLEAQGIEVVRGRARFTGPSAIEVEGRAIRAANFLVSTGSRPVVPAVPGLDGVPYFTPETIFEVTRRPSHLIVVGGGATGLALAQSHLRLGSPVTLIEMLEPLGDQDPEMAQAVLRRLRAEGLEVREHTGVVAISSVAGEIAVDVKAGPNEDRIVGSHLLFATGRRPDFDGLGLEAAKVRMTGDVPALGRFGRTSNRRIFVAGDAAGQVGTHAARHGAHMAVDAMLGGRYGRGAVVPRIVHTHPAIAWVGMTEPEARTRHGNKFEVVRAGFSQTDAAHAQAEANGHVKVLVGPRGTILGAGIVGPHAEELIAVLALAMSGKMGLDKIERLVVPHPSFSQAIALAAAQYARTRGGNARSGWRAALKRLLP
ncbi:NAD(P)/FAD-dependent oxidoreductase [Pelagibacterium sp. 26DY04]|uniref:dihydrolipoyl dehydrogenase family protein n=1 Tax=Pelagibacterium sp. 26DY04 TaxID=2967130 RepID=UPI00281499D1|nr:NAD(P)/FAD-dependent oxidoreductase [Pelagibacterium sp. 26DY04]WMT87459.1 NAD(P)/FAD-dependent oxidoreductase [Pelagibacterium sp. 26DY04]